MVPIGPTMSKQWGEGTVVVPAPREVDAIMKSVPSGKLITIQEIRAIVAERHGATIGCPLTVGIFAWIAAHAAEDDHQSQAARGDALLADAQIRRLFEREVSRRRPGPQGEARGRRPRWSQRGKRSPWRITSSSGRLPTRPIDAGVRGGILAISPGAIHTARPGSGQYIGLSAGLARTIGRAVSLASAALRRTRVESARSRSPVPGRELAHAKAASLAPATSQRPRSSAATRWSRSRARSSASRDRSTGRSSSLSAMAGQTHELITALVVIRGRADLSPHRCDQAADAPALARGDRALRDGRPTARLCRQLQAGVARDRPLRENRVDDHTAITGLPLIALVTILRELGYEIP